jgi:hypothetical protein
MLIRIDACEGNRLVVLTCRRFGRPVMEAGGVANSFGNLNKISWVAIEDSMGSAGEIPRILWTVVSGGPGLMAAVEELLFRICRDGIAVSEAAPVVVPFLWELVRTGPSADVRVEVIGLLDTLFKARQWSRAAAAAAPPYRKNYGHQVRWEADTRAAVLAGRNVLDTVIAESRTVAEVDAARALKNSLERES